VYPYTISTLCVYRGRIIKINSIVLSESLTDNAVKSRTVVEFASAHDFVVKFNASVCVAVVASLTGERVARHLPTMLMEQQTVANSAVICSLCATTKH